MKILIIGGGFAGIAAAHTLGKLSSKGIAQVTLIDRHTYTTMLPSLPDVAGGQIDKSMLVEDIVNLIPKSITFVQDTITSIDLNTKVIFHFFG